MMLANLLAVLQVVNDSPQLLGIVTGVAVLLAIVVGEILKSTLGPLLSRHDDPALVLLKRITDLLEGLKEETQAILVLAKLNHEWHDFRDASGRPAGYYPAEDVNRRLDSIEERLRRLQRSVTGSEGS